MMALFARCSETISLFFFFFHDELIGMSMDMSKMHNSQMLTIKNELRDELINKIPTRVNFNAKSRKHKFMVKYWMYCDEADNEVPFDCYIVNDTNIINDKNYTEPLLWVSNNHYLNLIMN